VDAAVPLLDGAMLNATQFVPSTVTSNVMVALNVPVICTATFPLDGNPSTVAASFCAATVTTADFRVPPGISYTPMLAKRNAALGTLLRPRRFSLLHGRFDVASLGTQRGAAFFV
jgi:hypothetical protein